MAGLLPEITHTIVEQYAAQVLDFSSQYGADNSFSYAAANCLGVPTKFPKYGKISALIIFLKELNFSTGLDRALFL